MGTSEVLTHRSTVLSNPPMCLKLHIGDVCYVFLGLIMCRLLEVAVVHIWIYMSIRFEVALKSFT